MQVVRVLEVTDDDLDAIDFLAAGGKGYQIIASDVIELTEERVRRHTEGVGWERRLISGWEAVDAAS